MFFCFKNLTKIFVVFLICVKTLVAQNIFIENKGQFDDKVIAKVNLPGGALFIQEGELCYAFYSQKKLDSIHNLLTQSRNIQTHAYSVEFINSNTDIKTFLIDSSNYYENYFLGSKEKIPSDKVKALAFPVLMFRSSAFIIFYFLSFRVFIQRNAY